MRKNSTDYFYFYVFLHFKYSHQSYTNACLITYEMRHGGVSTMICIVLLRAISWFNSIFISSDYILIPNHWKIGYLIRYELDTNLRFSIRRRKVNFMSVSVFCNVNKDFLKNTRETDPTVKWQRQRKFYTNYNNDNYRRS